MIRSPNFGALLLVLAVALPAAAQSTSPDDLLRFHVVSRVVEHLGAAAASRLDVHVANGTVTLRGALPKIETKRNLTGAIAAIPGVRVIDDRTHVADPKHPSAHSPCPPGTIAYRNGNDSSVHCIPAPACAPEQTRNAISGACECPAGKVAYRNGTDNTVRCVALTVPPCGAEQTRSATTGQCECPPGKTAYRNGNDPVGVVHCMAPPPCNAPQTRSTTTGQCECPPGKTAYRNGNDPPGVVHCL